MVKQRQTTVLFGQKNDQEVQQSIKKLKNTGRNVKLENAPSHDTGMGNCGKLCHCQEGHCASGAFKGDQGAMMGSSF